MADRPTWRPGTREGSRSVSRTNLDPPTPTSSVEIIDHTDFRPHAIIITERTLPSQVWVAAVLGVEKILRLDFDLSQAPSTYLRQALEKMPSITPAFGRPIGVAINYTPDHAIKYDLDGRILETLSHAIPIGHASLSIPFQFG